MSLNFNVSPYYDDFDPAKEFYRILFKPGYAVQARELTQLQTILGNQINNFAQNIFSNGSIVSGAAHQLDDGCFYLKVLPTYNNGTTTVNVDFSNFEGNYIVEESTGKIGYVKKYTPSNATDFPTLHVAIISGQQTPFNDSSNFYVSVNQHSNIAINYFTSATSASGSSLLFHLGEGVFYTTNNFVYCPEQTVVIGKYTKLASAVIGLNITESIVDYIDDSSLLDPALGASNYLAPGADRYKIDLELTTQTYVVPAVTYANFIQLSTIVNGQLTQDITTPIYSEILDTMAKRTYDTNGDFIVKNFLPNIVSDPQDTTKLILQISAGSAFVQGYELETLSPTTVSLDKAQTTATDDSYIINTTYGNYTYVNSLFGSLPSFNNSANNAFMVEIHNTNTSQSSSTKIGTAYIRGLEYVGGTGTGAVFALMIDSTSLTGTSFGSARSFFVSNGGNYALSPLFQANIDGSAFNGTQAQIFYSNQNTLLFELPRKYVDELQNVGYYYREYFSGTISGNTVSISCPNTDSFVGSGTGLSVVENYIVVETTNGKFIPMDNVSVTLSTSYTATLNFSNPLMPYNVNGHTINIIATVHTPGDSYRVKTLNANTLSSAIAISDISTHSLSYSDVYSLDYVYEFPSTSTLKGTWSSSTSYNTGDVVVYKNIAYISDGNSNVNYTPGSSAATGIWTALSDVSVYYTFNTGQTDTYYGYGSIQRLSAPINAIQAVAIFSYFSHSGTGYISAQSYPIDYDLIPTYKSATSGQILNLRDCIDFRPRLVDNLSYVAFNNHKIPTIISYADVIADITYYLGRVDKVVLTRDGVFKVLQGVPAYLNPQPPSNQSDAMTLFNLTFSPYTSQPTDVATVVVPHKRYTMKDISNLDTRLTNVEYYTALNLLEQQVNSTTLTANNGSTLYKNGFIVDAFTGSGVGDVTNIEYRSSIDYTNQVARPLYLADNVNLNYIQNLSNTVISGGTGSSAWSSLVTVPYTTQTFVNQPIASDTISVNPFGVVAFVGQLTLSPESDIWFDINTAPAVIVNTNGENDNYTVFTTVETQYNAWQELWAGVPTSEVASSPNSSVSSQYASSAPSTQAVASPAGVVLSTSELNVNQTVVPFARSTTINFKVEGMAGKTQLYLYINGLNMTNYMYPYSVSSNPNQQTVITDASGFASGYIVFPNDANHKFLCGLETFVISDNGFDIAQSTSYAQATFYSQGLLETLSPSLVSTKPNSYITTQLKLNSQNQNIGTVATTVNSQSAPATPPPTFTLTSDYTTIREGSSINFVFTTLNVPPGTTYNANISGSINTTNLGDGLTTGNTVIRTVGTSASSQAVLTVPINTGTVGTGANKYIILEVDVPSNISGGSSLQYLCNVAIQSSTIPTYTTQANSFVIPGNTTSFIFTAAGINSDVTVNYTVSGTALANITSTNASTTTGSFVLNATTLSNTLTYLLNSNYTQVGNDNLTLTYSFGGATKIATTQISPVASYGLNANVTNLIAGNSFDVLLTTHNVASGNLVPYTITGVTTGNLGGISLTGNFTVGTDGTANLIVNAASSISTTETFNISLNNITPTVSTSVGITPIPVATPAVPTPPPVVTPITINMPSTTTVGTSVQFIISNGPKNGTFTFTDSLTPTFKCSTLSLDVNGGFTDTFGILTALCGLAGTHNLVFTFSDSRTVSKSIVVTAVAKVVPTFTLKGPTSINDNQDSLSYTLTSVGQTTPITVNWTTSNPNNYSINNDPNKPDVGTVSGSNAGGPNYVAYVQSYADLIAFYTDVQNYNAGNPTVYYATEYPGNPLWPSVADELAGLKSGGPEITAASTSIAAFGQYHWQNFGQAENRTMPLASQWSGALTISDSSPVTINAIVGTNGTTTGGSGSITFTVATPTVQTITTTINNTVNSLLPPGPAPVPPKQASGDFIDSPLTLAAAISEYTYIVPSGQNYETTLADPNAHGKMWLVADGTAGAPNTPSSANTVASYVAATYRNPAYLNQNPDLNGFIYWVNRILSLQCSTNVTTDTWYNVSGTYGQTSDSTGFNSSYGVWVAPAGDPSSILPGVTNTSYREWNNTTAGTYTIFLGADDWCQVTNYITGATWATFSDSNEWPKGNYWTCTSGYVPVGGQIMQIQSLNGNTGATTWSQNPAFFAIAIYAGTYTSPPIGVTPVWDSRTHSASETVPIGPGLTLAQAETQALTEFIAAQKGQPIGSRASFVACTTDPLAQTFFVSEASYPNGVFLTGIGLYFSAVDDSLPVFTQIRTTENGYPSSDTVVPLTTVWKHPNEINTSTDGSEQTLFQFTDPVYLKPGQYAIVVGSNSSLYKVYYATVGQPQIGSTNLVAAQPNVGVLFESKNASTWIANESSDLAFTLYQAQFNTGNTFTAVFHSAAPTIGNFYFSTVDITTSEIDFNHTTSLTYLMNNQLDGTRDSSNTSILANQNKILPSVRNNQALGDTVVYANLLTNDPNVSPVIDTDRMSMIMVQNIISDTSQQTIPETNPSGGNAAAKYITRAVTLEQGFEAENISVFFDANMQSGSSIQVYVKVLAADDNDTFANKPWIQVPSTSSTVTYSTSYSDFLEQEYTLSKINYLSNAVQYNNFQTFAVKVVFYSDDAAIVPQIQNFRAIATS